MGWRPSHGDPTKIPTPSLQAAALFINFFFPTLAVITVGLRAYSRVKTRQWGLDDHLICVALLFSILMVAPFYLDIKLSYIGWRQEDVFAYDPNFDPSAGQWWFYIAQLFYNPVLALVKASILVFLLRLGSHQRWVRWFIYGLNTFNGLQAVAIFLVALLQCLPISANWDAEVRATAKCVDVSFHVSISCLTIFTDVLVLALPFWIFLGLKMPPAAKVALMGVFLLGLAVTIIAIVRLVSLHKLFYAPWKIGDPFHDIGKMLSVVEVNLAIICACGPALRPLFRSWLPSLFGGSTGKYDLSNLAKGNTGGVYGNGGSSSKHMSGRRPASMSGGIALKSVRLGSRLQHQHTECRSVSPSGSEEEIMTYNGILRTTQVRMEYGGNGERDGVDSASKASKDTYMVATQPA